MVTIRSSFHVTKETKELLEKLRLDYNRYSIRKVSQENFLKFLAKKMRRANLEAVSFIEYSKVYNKLLKENNLEIEILPILIIPNNLFEIVEELYRLLNNLNMSFEYFTTEKQTAIVFKKTKQEDVEIPVVK